MIIDWTSHLKDPEEKAKFQSRIKSEEGLKRLSTIVDSWEKQLDRTETSIQVYDTPNWNARQAHKNGNREIINNIQLLIRSIYDR